MVNNAHTTTDPALFSVPEFCRAHSITRSFLYALLAEGNGPAITKLGRRTLISREAATAWRARMESETQQPTAARKLVAAAG